ncbi:hypothetical protein ACIFOC_00461 [Leucobacter aridicollis]|uniref:Uncharacterized protein n=1 Tax=Leucobacter aridicollis TaxID=283878 RepID=A0A852QV06_9MICO|nr:hypothetical protein [Leucobacter aridicollis]
MQIAETKEQIDGALNMVAFLRGRLTAVVTEASVLAAPELQRLIDAILEVEFAKLREQAKSCRASGD